MLKFIQSLPKTSISLIYSAILVYALGKGYIGPDEANFISSLMVALGLSVNLQGGKFKSYDKSRHQ